jgi:hypothetical protein
MRATGLNGVLASAARDRLLEARKIEPSIVHDKHGRKAPGLHYRIVNDKGPEQSPEA